MAKPKMSAQALDFLSAPAPAQVAVGPQESAPIPAKAPDGAEQLAMQAEYDKAQVQAGRKADPKARAQKASAKEPAGSARIPTAEERLLQLQAELEALQQAAREEKIRKAKYPWQNPDVVQNQPRLGYNMKLEPELYLKIQWLMENRGGIKSIQVFLDRAAKKLAQEMLEEMGAV